MAFGGAGKTLICDYYILRGDSDDNKASVDGVMHITEYGSYEELVITLVKTSLSGCLLFTVRHEGEDDGAHVGVPEIIIPGEIITSARWENVIEKSTFMMIEEGKLDEIWRGLVKLVLRFRMGEFVEVSNVIIDGVILKISDIFSRFLERKGSNFEEFNFRLVYLIFDKICELDEVSGYKVQINESNDIWKIVEKIYLPCRDDSDYEALLNFIDDDEEKEEEKGKEIQSDTMGDGKFVKLSEVLHRCNIKWYEY